MSTMLKVTIHAGKQGLPLRESQVITSGGGQVIGDGANVPAIVRDFGVRGLQTTEAGRTSRATISYAREYTDFLNHLHSVYGSIDLSILVLYWVKAVREFLERDPIQVKINGKWSDTHCVDAIVAAARSREKNFAGETIVGTVMQHLVGAVLELNGCTVEHSNSNKADKQYARQGDFDFPASVWHVTSAPSERLIEKCFDNLKLGMRPTIVTLDGKLQAAKVLLENRRIEDRVDVVSFQQAIVIYLNHQRIKDDDPSGPLSSLLEKYNSIIEQVEADQSLRIEISS